MKSQFRWPGTCMRRFRSIGAMHVEMRVHGEPLAILPAARKVVQQMDPNLPLIEPDDPAGAV